MVPGVCQGISRPSLGNSEEFEGCSRDFRKFQGRFKGVLEISKGFQVSSKGSWRVSSQFQGNFS